jgi:hypothetical protein
MSDAFFLWMTRTKQEIPFESTKDHRAVMEGKPLNTSGIAVPIAKGI